MAGRHSGEAFVKRTVKTILRALTLLGMATVVLVLSGLGLLLIARQALKPVPGEWATSLRVGSATVEVGVPSLIWLGTTPWVSAMLDGHSLPTRAGRIHMRWQVESETLELRCSPCSIPARGLGVEAFRIDEARLSVRRRGSHLEGSLSSGNLVATWHGTLSPRALNLKFNLPASPIRDGYALFASVIPEVPQATISGSFGFSATLALPSGNYTLKPHVDGFSVQGLGTATFMGARSTCSAGLRKSRLRTDSLLARAVLAAEDQRFFEHAGFDLVEFTSAFQRNQREGHIERGASTLSQQLARLLITGSERTPTRKLRELLYAVEMEQTLGKARILRLYLDNAPWGDGICGADAAARQYFGLRAQELDAGQAVWLAAMLHNPAMEAHQWATTGQINVARAQWVATGLRPMLRSEREELSKSLTEVVWPIPALGQ
jgi:Transglycosylase